MDLQAIVETTVEMWVLIDSKLKARQQGNLDPEIKATILREAMSLYITNIIKGTKSTLERSDDSEAPRQASEKQLKYIDDLGGDRSQIHTAKEASDEIKRLKNE